MSFPTSEAMAARVCLSLTCLCTTSTSAEISSMARSAPIIICISTSRLRSLSTQPAPLVYHAVHFTPGGIIGNTGLNNAPPLIEAMAGCVCICFGRCLSKVVINLL